jgi:hypothetical protein
VETQRGRWTWKEWLATGVVFPYVMLVMIFLGLFGLVSLPHWLLYPDLPHPGEEALSADWQRKFGTLANLLLPVEHLAAAMAHR